MKPRKPKIEVTFLDTTLVECQIDYALCLDEAQYLAAIAAMQARPRHWVNPSAGATTHFFSNEQGAQIALVCLDGGALERARVGVASVLVHEAVHIWQQHKELIGEERPSAEFEAYSIQRIAENLMQSYLDQTAKK